jgi:2-polyprenyl-3-methyl-5-hydroxy-6-metoxy-1,4-benzoquinol methylase
MGFSLSMRRREAEIQDQPDLDRELLHQALRGLERLNRWCGVSRTFWPPIRDLAEKTGSSPLRILDVGTGAGDLPIRLWQLGRSACLPLEITGCDLNVHTIAYAQERAAQAQAAVRFFAWDALSGPFPGQYDVVVSSLFLHHLDDDQVVMILRRMAEAASELVLVNDLERSLTGWLYAYLGTRLLFTSKVNRVDGPRSVAAAFTMEEVRYLALRAGLEGAALEKRWPCRYLLKWVKRTEEKCQT